MYQQTTRGFTVTVEPEFLEERSEPESDRYFWAYHITIENAGGETAQLVTRHWRITDALGRQQNVDGDGVVGEQPTLEPGEQFSYSSGCPLDTPSGIMVGSYTMRGLSGEDFDIAVPAFSLDSPYEQARIN